ncbi:MAG: extracellular solute-binding protein [Actinomycetota bacterium]|nr:extracellular solute-binding protein [Actinomycetota bacterium]
MRIPKLLTVLLVLGLVAAACGGDDDDTASDTTVAGSDTTATADGDEASGDEGDEGGDGETIRLWLNGGDTPDEVVDYAIEEFNALHPDVEVAFERQQWTGIVEKLTTSLSSSDSPDVIELGNTQAQTFEAAGALMDLTDRREELGGDDFLQSLAEAGTYEGSFYAAPYYAGARVIIYRKDLFEAAGIEVPTTLDELVEAGVALKEANADVANFSGIYLPGRNWHGVLPLIWAHGGDIATQDGDTWTGELSSPESVEGLEMFKTIFDDANAAPADADDSTDYIAFCNGEVGMMPAPGWKPGQIINEEDGCPDMEENIGVFAMPGLTADETAPVFLGGSNLAVSANSEHPDLAFDLLAIMTSPEYQSMMAEAGLIPARLSVLDQVGGSEAAEAQAIAAQNSRFVPTSENWAAVEAGNVLQDMLTTIAQTGDIAGASATADEAIEGYLNG